MEVGDMSMVTPQEVSVPEIEEGPRPGPVIVIDPRKCIGCRACEVACEREHGIGNYHITVSLIESAKIFAPFNCRHCAKAPCVTVCPVEACHFTPEGIVHIDPIKCIGCKLCGIACPFGIPEFKPERKIMVKCDMCLHRLREGKEPACATTCPTGALTFVRRYAEIAKTRRAKSIARMVRASFEASELEKTTIL